MNSRRPGSFPLAFPVPPFELEFEDCMGRNSSNLNQGLSIWAPVPFEVLEALRVTAGLPGLVVMVTLIATLYCRLYSIGRQALCVMAMLLPLFRAWD